MIDTKNRAKADTIEYVARLVEHVELDDPEAEGNGGLQGIDEEATSETFTSLALATRWLRAQAKARPQMVNAEITEIEWVADDVADDEYGIVRDAYAESIHVWSFYVGAKRALEADGDHAPTRW